MVEYRATFSKTISESDVYLFAGITGDFNPIHVNCIEAQRAFAGERIVHGTLLTGLISTVIGMQLPGPGTVYMEQDSKFLKPVYIGDTVTAVVEMDTPINVEKQIWRLKTTVSNQNDELVLEGYAIVKAPKLWRKE